MKILRIVFSSGYSQDFIVSNQTANWSGWNIIGNVKRGTLRFRHNEGVARVPVSKIVICNILNKNVMLNDNPLDNETYYDNPLR